MMKSVTVQVADEVYDALEQTAAENGKPTEAVAQEWLTIHARRPRPQLQRAEGEAAGGRFERHFGAWDSGDSCSADNERIDADLARAYGEAEPA